MRASVNFKLQERIGRLGGVTSVHVGFLRMRQFEREIDEVKGVGEGLGPSKFIT